MSKEWDPQDPFNTSWQDELYEYCRTLDDDATFFTVDEDDEGRLPETDCLEMDEKMYAEVFNSGKVPEKPWFVAFIRKRRSEDRHSQSAYIVNQMKLLADQYKGEVRFAYIDAMKFRNLELAFGVKLLPTSFFYKDGIWYE